MDKDNNNIEDKSQDEIQKDDASSSDDSVQILEFKKEIAQLKDLLIREKAENENLRKRFAKELEEAHKFAVTNFAKVLIEQLEDLFRALENVDKEVCNSNEELKTLFEGVEMTKNNMIRSFEVFDICRIHPLNEPFNPELHQAISQIVDSNKEPNTIVSVVQSGYSIKGRLLKAASVVVSKKEE